MEGKNTTLLTLLILIQFAEMKSAVLKDISQEKLWAICYNGASSSSSAANHNQLILDRADIVERFQLLVSLVLLFFYNISKHHINSFWVRITSDRPLHANDGVQDEDWLTASEWLAPLLFSLMIIYMSELSVDWLKHTSIINFTDLGPHMYTEVCPPVRLSLGSSSSHHFLSYY